MELSRSLLFTLTLTAITGLFTQQSVAQTETLKMAANLVSEPFIYRDNGEIKGFEVELIKEIGRLNGFNVEFHPAIFPQVFRDLQEKKIDFIGHVYNDEERGKLYNLTDPHYIENIKLLTLKDKNITNPLENGLVYSTLAFSPLEEEFTDAIQQDYPQLKKQSDQTTYLGFKNLFLKNADILMTTETNIERLTNNYPKYEYQRFSLPEKYQQQIKLSFLTRKDNPELMRQINDGLKILKANGTYDSLKKKYNL